ncbi:MAG: hypothetical protein AUJ72_00725 [Candidatus Omnitrophica bacterium CG1_02_46_14]|nr:MAG: hypothetical protein AUJ72_00725 [Candidatus Omnitrophica bacterium CG1_02_46_14]
MRIGVDYSSVISKKTGIGSFASYLTEEFLKREDETKFLLYKPKDPKDLNTVRRMYWESVSLYQKAVKDQIEILYSPGFAPCRFGRFKKVVTVHDLIGMIFPNNVGKVSRFYWTTWLPASLRKADRLVASSECTRRDIERLLGIPMRAIEVVPLAARPIFQPINGRSETEAVLTKYGIKRPYLISVSTLEPRKNLLALIKAFHSLIKKEIDVNLVIVGKSAGAETEMQNYITANKLNNRVKVLGYLPDDELVIFYNAAMAYVMISLYEGFGLPALEAMGCGLTGVVSNNSSLPEVVGATALKVDPNDIGEISEALEKTVCDEPQRNQMARMALERSGSFSIKNTADRMIDIFRATAGS